MLILAETFDPNRGSTCENLDFSWDIRFATGTTGTTGTTCRPTWAAGATGAAGAEENLAAPSHSRILAHSFARTHDTYTKTKPKSISRLGSLTFHFGLTPQPPIIYICTCFRVLFVCCVLWLFMFMFFLFCFVLCLVCFLLQLCLPDFIITFCVLFNFRCFVCCVTVVLFVWLLLC